MPLLAVGAFLTERQIMKTITVYVEEKLYHKVVINLDDDSAEELLQDLRGDNANEVAGDLTSRTTVNDGEYELIEFKAEEYTKNRK